MSTGGGVPALRLQPKQRAKISSIDQWCSAFNIFMTTCLIKFPAQEQAILKYSETVRHIKKSGGILSLLKRMCEFRDKITPLHGTLSTQSNML